MAVESSQPSGSVLSTPERRRLAIHMLEDDADLSDQELTKALVLMEKKPSVADTYSAIRSKDNCTRFITAEIDTNIDIFA